MYHVIHKAKIKTICKGRDSISISLIGTVVNSEKRKNLLLLLKDGPKDMETILALLKTKRTALLPQIKIMEEKHLLVKDDDICELTVIGKMVAEKITPLLDTMEFFGEYTEYWETHDLDFIPSHLLKRISEIGDYTILKQPLSEIFEMSKVLEDGFRRTRNSRVITSILYPNSVKILASLIDNEIDIFFITNQKILEKMKTEENEKFKQILECGKMRFFLYNKEIRFPAFVLNDDGLFLYLAQKDKKFENRMLMSCSSDALAWGRELFECYMKDIVPITNWENLDQLLECKGIQD